MDLLKHPLLNFTPRVTDSVGLGYSKRFCFSSKFPGDCDAAGFKDHTLRTAAYVKRTEHHCQQQNGA